MDAQKVMTLKECRLHIHEALSKIYPKTEIDSFFFLMIEEKLNLQRIDTVLKPDLLISQDNLTTFLKIIKRLQNEEPIQYILKKTSFYGLPFIVDKNTLIPRPETEELVAWIIEEASKGKLHKKDKISILDIGTGTGCIPISLAKNLIKSSVSAIDISQKALLIAKKNALLNNTKIDFFEMDILNTESLPQKFDIIVSNPPYVRELEKREIKKNVLQNEPHLALFVDNNNPLLFYKKIADLAIEYLRQDGLLFFEINQYLEKETVKMLEMKGFKNIELRKDLFGNYRMIQCNNIL
ncbi:MAG: peptide chain release factor N(5)-glutamine methyltransferase [Polaribacter sp.]|jgi:release factor glutamine methyltransferase|nr:peptide chain release factor N(5)-glutamine methyltransferase [Polaribacter sp.]